MTEIHADPRLTEARNPRTYAIDRADSRTIVALIQSEDRAVPTAVASQEATIAGVIDEVVRRFRSGGRLIYVGAGTSGRLGTLDASECPPTFGVDPSLVRAVIAGGPSALVESSEGAEDVHEAGAEAMSALDVGDQDFVLGIATSGTTPYVHGAVAEAVSRGAGTGFLCCAEPPTEVGELVDHLIVALVGPEVIAGSTRMKAGTATKLILNTITTGAMIGSGRVYENLMVDLRARSAKLVDRGIRIVVEVTGRSREEARQLLVKAGGGVKTALAMDRLTVDRGTAERYLDSVGGFLGAAIERFEDGPRVYYGAYPEGPAGPDPTDMLDRLARAPDLLTTARDEAASTEAVGRRVPLNPVGWTAGQHISHLRDFECTAVRPRVSGWFDGSEEASSLPTFDDWIQGEAPPREVDFESMLVSFASERAATTAAIREPLSASLARRARIGDEIVTLYQFLRGICQHDEAHAIRIRERVHPALLRRGDA